MGTGADGPAGRDFFVSYTQADRAWAEWIAWVLEEDGHQVLVQAWDFVPGSNWIVGMQAGVAEAARTIAVLSPDYLTSQYGTAEWEAAWASDPAGKQRKLLTVRVAECGRPGLLAGVVGVDLFGRPEAEARGRLRAMVSSAVAGRANLGKILRDLGEPARARPLAERALAIDEATYGPGHPYIATDLNNLAAILQDLGEQAQARRLEARAVVIANRGEKRI
jgi:tetratricopeptide (TPR) repeat protein